MYIYKTTNKVNGKIYIGLSTKDYDPKYLGSGKLINSAIKKYGSSNFSKEILEHCNSKKTLVEAERKYISLYKSDDPSIGYNISPGGDLNPDVQRMPIWQYDIEGNLINKFLSIELAATEINDRNLYRNKEIEKRPIKGFWFSKTEKTKEEIQESHRLYSEERKAKFKNAANKRWSNVEYRNKMTDNINEARKMAKNWSKSEETKKKISNAIKGKRWYNNGIVEGQYFECPVEWKPGRLR